MSQKYYLKKSDLKKDTYEIDLRGLKEEIRMYLEEKTDHDVFYFFDWEDTVCFKVYDVSIDDFLESIFGKYRIETVIVDYDGMSETGKVFYNLDKKYEFECFIDYNYYYETYQKYNTNTFVDVREKVLEEKDIKIDEPWFHSEKYKENI